MFDRQQSKCSLWIQLLNTRNLKYVVNQNGYRFGSSDLILINCADFQFNFLHLYLYEDWTPGMARSYSINRFLTIFCACEYFVSPLCHCLFAPSATVSWCVDFHAIIALKRINKTWQVCKYLDKRTMNESPYTNIIYTRSTSIQCKIVFDNATSIVGDVLNSDRVKA